MYKRWLIWIILSALALSNLGAARQDSLNYGPSGTIRGYVYLDSNRNGKFDDGEKGLPGVYVTISFGEYYHTYYTGDGDPEGDVPGPGSYGPTDLPGGGWTVTLHVPDGYRATSAKTLPRIAASKTLSCYNTYLSQLSNKTLRSLKSTTPSPAPQVG